MTFFYSLSLYCDGAVSLSSLVRVANEIGLAGLHKAKALWLVSLRETAVALPSEREGSMEKEEGVCRAEEGKGKVFWGKGDGRLNVERNWQQLLAIQGHYHSCQVSFWIVF